MREHKILFSLILIFSILISCKDAPILAIEKPPVSPYGPFSTMITKDRYYDKVLGALVGSAIGDAMGASTEMWDRAEIQAVYGFINSITPVVRQKSPEGTWEHNLPAGGTTDDTRWKYLLGKYLLKNSANLTDNNFASYITNYYQSLIKSLSEKSVQLSTDLLDDRMDQVNWIKEWARVTIAHKEGIKEYEKSLNRFYGGEMSCAGLLYTPMFGLVSATTELAYETAYDHAIFDIGYAKDISSLASALTFMALHTDDMDSIMNTVKFVDPFDYQDSRLIGRLAYNIFEDSQNIVDMSSENLLEDSSKIIIPQGYNGDYIEWGQLDFIYTELDKRKKSISFHAGEIWQILLAGLYYGDGEFTKTMTFIVNYGRDNDTVAAIAGFILGARSGYSSLPIDLKEEVLKVSKELMNLDLEETAREIVDSNWHQLNTEWNK